MNPSQRTKSLFLTAFLALLIAPSSLSNSISLKAEEKKLVYDCATDFSEAMDGKYDCIAHSANWWHESINLKEFTKSGQGTSLQKSDGSLRGYFSFNDHWSGTWTDEMLSLRTFALWCTPSSIEYGREYFYWTNGWKMCMNDNPGSVSSFPRGYCSANVTSLKYYRKGILHPGDGAGVVTYFQAPRAGKVTISDNVQINSAMSDGMYLCIYHIPVDEAYFYAYNTQTGTGLFGGAPIYPTKGVHPSSDWGTGWFHCAAATTTSYSVPDIEVKQGDLIAWVYGSGPTNGYDTTHTSPKVTYDSADLDASSSAFDHLVSEAKNEIKYYRDPSDYRTAEQEQLNAAIADGLAAINACTNESELEEAVSAAKAAIDAIATRYGFEDAELEAYKEAAKEELLAYANLDAYSEEDQSKIRRQISSADISISGAESKEEVDVLLQKGKAAIANLGLKTIEEKAKGDSPAPTMEAPTNPVGIALIIVGSVLLLAGASLLTFSLRKKHPKKEAEE